MPLITMTTIEAITMVTVVELKLVTQLDNSVNFTIDETPLFRSTLIRHRCIVYILYKHVCISVKRVGARGKDLII